MRPGLTALVTYRPDGSQPRALSQLGHISPAVYSYALPGGCDALTATFARPPRYRTDALDPGRLLRAYRGGAVVWSGILDEPAPGSGGWSLSAHGAGSFGNDYRAIWTGTWGTPTLDQIVNNAIGRGLNWANPGIGSPAGLWAGQAVDSGSVAVTDALNNACSKGGLTWIVTTTDTGSNVLSVVPRPSAPNRLLIIGDPMARSAALGPTTLYVRYQSAADGGKTPAAYGLTSVTTALREPASGRVEDYMDLSSAGAQTAGQAQAPASAVLQKFQRDAFTASVTVRHGSLLNLGGTPCDPGAYLDGNMTAMVCKLLLADYTPVSDVITGAPSVLVGSYSWDDAALLATITPSESIRHNFASLMQMIAGTAPHRTRPTHRHHKSLHH
jgi:hypothetical protein